VTRLFHHAAVGIVINSEQQILISKRPSHKLKGGYWEFPGGKIEEQETPSNALIRELQEEIGIEVKAVEPWMQYQYSYNDEAYDVLLEVFLVREFLGSPKALEEQEILWINMADFDKFNFLEPNRFIIKKIMNDYLQ